MPVLAIRSEREGGQVVLEGTSANIDGDQDLGFTFPAGFGDCYLIRSVVIVASIATLVANPEIKGPLWILQDPASVSQDILGSERWNLYFTARVTAQYAPLIAPLVREGEQFRIQFLEIDSDASPTADVTFQALVQRRQNMPGTQPAPIEEPLMFTS